jgi:hypothetical protein
MVGNAGDITTEDDQHDALLARQRKLTNRQTLERSDFAVVKCWAEWNHLVMYVPYTVVALLTSIPNK